MAEHERAERTDAAPAAVSSPARGAGGPAAAVLALQRSAGNRAVRALIQRAEPSTPVPELAAPTTFPEPVPEPDPELPWRTDRIVDWPPGPERIYARDVGNWIHNNYELVQQDLLPYAELLTAEPLPPDLEPEYRIPDPKIPPLKRDRIDRVDWRNFEVIEIKPESRRAEAEAQAQRYASEMNKYHRLPNGRSWTWRVVTYDLRRATGMLLEFGYFSKESVRLPPLYSWRLDAYARNAMRLPPPRGLPPALRAFGPLGPLHAYMRPGRSFTPAPASALPEPASPLRGFMRPTSPSTPAPPVPPARPFTPVPYGFPPERPQPWTPVPNQPLPAAPPGTERVSKDVIKRAAGKGVVAFNIVTAVPSTMAMARDMRIAEQQPHYLGPAILEDEHGQYTLRWEDGWIWNAYFKTYVSGAKQGQEVELDWWEWRAEIAKKNAKYGYFDWKGDFIEGEVKPVYHSGVLPEKA